MKGLLIDILPIKLERSQITESIGKNNGRLIIPNMVIQRADKPNKNQRVYPRSILEREMSKVMNGIKQAGSRGLIGELDHPESNVINLKNACNGILDYRWKGNDMLGDVEILNTPSGNILKEILLAGYVPGISSRGLGSVESVTDDYDSDVVEVQEDFELLTFDSVSDPSTHNAYFKEVVDRGLHESRQVRTSDKYDRANQLITEIICEISGVCCLK